MTDTELKAEWNYWHQESLAIQCADREPTPQQIDIAFREATEHCERLKND